MSRVVAKRIDVIWINPFTKETGLTQGNMVTGRYVPVYNSPKGSRYTYELFGEPFRPDPPKNTYALAYATLEKSTDDDGATFTTSVTDIINTDRPSDRFDSGSDFQVSLQGISLDDEGIFDITGGTFIPGGLLTRASSTSAVRNSVSWSVPKGQYDVRLRRSTDDATDDRIRDEVQWTALRNIKNTEPVDPTFASENNIAQTQVVIRATDQLNGIVDQLNAECSSILPDYDPSSGTWVERVTSNCASIARDIWQGNASKKPITDAQLDLDALETLWQRCQDRLMEFNGVIQGGSASDALKQVLSNARASRTLIDGVRSVVIDQEKTDIVQHFTPRNSSNFRGSKRFAVQPHALKVRFQNRLAGYAQDEVIVYDDGFSADGTNCVFPASDGSCSVATKFETLDTRGIVLGEQAYQYGRYQLATNKLRPENYQLDVDVEHLVATPSDRVAVTHDVPMFGLGSGRVKSLQTSGSDTVGVTLDEELELAADTDYTLRFRLADGDTLTRELEQVGSDTATHTVTFKNPIATGSGPAVGDLAMFGLLDQETVACIIKGITGGDPDWGATLELVDHSQPEIDNSADSAIPDFDTNITENPFVRSRPAPPVVQQIQTDETVLKRDATGGLSAQLVVTVTPPSADNERPSRLQMRFRSTESQSFRQVEEIDRNQIATDDVDQGDYYRVELRYVTEEGVTSQWVVADPALRIIGATNNPSAVTGLTVQAVSSLAVLRWNRHPDLDVRVGGRIEFRHSKLMSGATWQDSVQIGESVNGDQSEVVLPLKRGTYLVRARDAGDRRSEETAVSSRAATAVAFTSLDSVQEDALFPGTNSGTVVDDTRATPALKLSGVGLVDDIPDFDAISSLDSYGGIESSGTYTFDTGIDLGSVKPVQVLSDLSVVIANVENRIDDRSANIDTWESFDGNAAAEGNAAVWVRETDDDPDGSPSWSEWQRLDVGEYSARAFQFQCRITSIDPAYQVFVEELRASVQEVT